MMESNFFNQRERDSKKIIIAFSFSIIMIFSAFAILNFTTTAEKSRQAINNHPLPVVSYSQFGETVSFIGSQPAISFGSTEYPTSWNILNIEQPSHLSADPLHANNNNSNSSSYLSVAQFNSYTTSRINSSAQNSANLIQYGKGIQAASVFFFDNYTMSSSLAFKNLLNHSAAYMVDFTMILPETGSFTEGGAGTRNVKMNNGSGIINPSCYDIQIGGININWQSESSLFHGGIITQKYNHDMLAAPMGPVTLTPNETYTIDPQIEPIPQSLPGGGGIHKSGGGGGGGTQNPCTLYPPEFSDVSLQQSSSTCFANGSSEGKVAFRYCVDSPTGDGAITMGYFEIARNGQNILLGTSEACQYSGYTKTFTLNNIGCYEHLGIAYKDPTTDLWMCISQLGHKFNEFINPDYGYIYPNKEIQSNAGSVLNSNGKSIEQIVGGISANPAYPSSRMGLYQEIVSKHSYYGACNRSVVFKYNGNSFISSGSRQSDVSQFPDCLALIDASGVTGGSNGKLLNIVLDSIEIGLTIAGIAFPPSEGVAAVISVSISLYQIYSSADSIPKNWDVNNGKTFSFSAKANSSEPNLGKNYFYYGCYQNSIVFNQNITTYIGTIISKNPPSHYMNTFSFNEGFVLFNTSLIGQTYIPTYDVGMTNPVYYEYYEGT